MTPSDPSPDLSSDDQPAGDPPAGYQGALRQAERLAKDPEGTEQLLVRAAEKAERMRNSKQVEGFWNDLMVLFRLLRARLAGRYKTTPWRTIVSALAGIVYFVNPLDVVPDVIPFVGFIDDAAVIAFVIRIAMGDLQRFLAWEEEQAADDADDAVPVVSETKTTGE